MLTRTVPSSGWLPSAPDRQRGGQRQDDDGRRCETAPQRAPPERLEDGDIARQHPQRSAEDARVFVPLHGPDLVRETVAQHEPRPRELAGRVPVFGGDPRRGERGVGQRRGGFFRNGVEQHEGDHVEGRRSQRRGERPDGRGVPYPPDGQRVPQDERQRRPAEHATPRAARAVVRPLIHSRGTNPTSSVSPVMPSQPVESRRAERVAAASFRDMGRPCVILRFYVRQK